MPEQSRLVDFTFPIPPGVPYAFKAIAAPGTWPGTGTSPAAPHPTACRVRTTAAVCTRSPGPPPGSCSPTGTRAPPAIGRAVHTVETPAGLDVLFEIDETRQAQHAVMRRASSGDADLSIGSLHFEGVSGSEMLYEVALVDHGAFPRRAGQRDLHPA